MPIILSRQQPADPIGRRCTFSRRCAGDRKGLYYLDRNSPQHHEQPCLSSLAYCHFRFRHATTFRTFSGHPQPAKSQYASGTLRCNRIFHCRWYQKQQNRPLFFPIYGRYVLRGHRPYQHCARESTSSDLQRSSAQQQDLDLLKRTGSRDLYPLSACCRDHLA